MKIRHLWWLIVATVLAFLPGCATPDGPTDAEMNTICGTFDNIKALEVGRSYAEGISELALVERYGHDPEEVPALIAQAISTKCPEHRG